MPPPKLEISRLVLCKNFNPRAADTSCSMGARCKFVHADLRGTTPERHQIHVNYAWRSLDLVAYERLPAGEVLRVSAPNNRQPITDICSEQILVTRGSLQRHHSSKPLSHCAHFFFNRACHRGESCNFIHAVHLDETAKDFQRAPARSTRNQSEGRPFPDADANSVVSDEEVSDLSCGCNSSTTGSCTGGDDVRKTFRAPLYRRNPYSLMYVTVEC